MVAKCSEPSPVSDKHQEHPMMATSQASRHLINCKCRRTECCGMTCQNKDPRDEYAKGTCHSDGRDSQIFKACGCRKPRNRSNCQATEPLDENVKHSCHIDKGESQTIINKVSGESNDSFSGHSKARQESHYEHSCSQCQQPSHSSNDDPCIGKQFRRKKDDCDCGMTCQQINTVTIPGIPESTTPTTKQNIEPPESLEEQENLIRRTNHEGDQTNKP